MLKELLKKNYFTAIGTMSGTSCDGIDVALIKTDGKKQSEVLDGKVFEYSKEISGHIRSVMKSENNLDILKLEHEITKLHADAINNFLNIKNIKAEDIDLVGFHGQTIVHLPDQGITQQIGDPHLLAEHIKIPVINDFRRADLAAGGQGAPLVPMFHKALADSLFLNKVVFLNIGGISNITYINSDTIYAFDIGPGNAQIDDLLKKKMDILYDKDGAVSAKGSVITELIDEIMSDEFFQKYPPKSLDREYFNKYHTEKFSISDTASTWCKIISLSLKNALELINADYKAIVICGGGRKNPSIIKYLKECFENKIKIIDELGINGCFIEAYAFGYLAVRSILGDPLSTPSTTGSRESKTGGSISFF